MLVILVICVLKRGIIEQLMFIKLTTKPIMYIHRRLKPERQYTLDYNVVKITVIIVILPLFGLIEAVT